MKELRKIFQSVIGKSPNTPDKWLNSCSGSILNICDTVADIPEKILSAAPDVSGRTHFGYLVPIGIAAVYGAGLFIWEKRKCDAENS